MAILCIVKYNLESTAIVMCICAYLFLYLFQKNFKVNINFHALVYHMQQIRVHIKMCVRLWGTAVHTHTGALSTSQ